MDAQLKAKWIEALRSGEYMQGRAFFKKDNSFCCLGVLCDVAGVNPVEDHGFSNWGFADETLGFKPDGRCWSDKLASMNDTGKTFTEIADYIEASL